MKTRSISAALGASATVAQDTTAWAGTKRGPMTNRAPMA